MSLGSVFNRGLDGLSVNQRALSVAANNIANMNTKGYARQQLLIGARALVPGDYANGGGAQALGLMDVTSPFIEMQLFETANSLGTADGRKQTIQQLEGIFNDSAGQGLGKALSDFFGSLNDLASNPNSMPTRQTVKDRGTLLAQKFNQMSNQINLMRRNLSSEIETRLETINGYAEQIASLNEQIVNAGGSAKALDLAAQRRLVLRQLSEEVNISYYEESNGAVLVQAGNGSTLVNRGHAGSFSVSSDDTGPGGTIAISLTYPNTTNSIDITNALTGGRLGGNLTDRNTTLNDYLDDLDTLAYEMTTQFNAIHTTGYGLDGNTGRNFFAALTSATGAAGSMALDSALTANVIAAGQQAPATSGPGDNRVALLLVALQTDQTMSPGNQTFSQYYQTLVGGLGVMASGVEREYETQAGLINQIETQREAVSGVNMDEEGADIIRFQRAFQASQKIMQVADQLMGELLKI